jgi:hypothetical protein
VQRLEENLRSLDVVLTKDGLDRLERPGPKDAVAGHQYEPGMMKLMMRKNRRLRWF